MIWPHREGVATYASKTQTFEFARDGIDFLSHRFGQQATPKPIAPGCYRPELTEPALAMLALAWLVLSLTDKRAILAIVRKAAASLPVAAFRVFRPRW